MAFEPGVQKFCRMGRDQRTLTLPLPLLRIREIQKVHNINRVNFMFVHIFSQAVLERSNYRSTQSKRNPIFKAKSLVTQAELSIGFIPTERSFLRPSIELFFFFFPFFWNSLIAYVEKKYSFNRFVKMDCY